MTDKKAKTYDLTPPDTSIKDELEEIKYEIKNIKEAINLLIDVMTKPQIMN